MRASSTIALSVDTAGPALCCWVVVPSYKLMRLSIKWSYPILVHSQTQPMGYSSGNLGLYNMDLIFQQGLAVADPFLVSFGLGLSSSWAFPVWFVIFKTFDSEL